MRFVNVRDLQMFCVGVAYQASCMAQDPVEVTAPKKLQQALADDFNKKMGGFNFLGAWPPSTPADWEKFCGVPIKFE